MADGARIFLGLTSCRNVDLRHRNATGRQHHDERHGHDSGSLGKRAAQLEDPAARVAATVGCLPRYRAVVDARHRSTVMCCRGFRWNDRGMADTAQLRRLTAWGRAEGGAIVRETVARAFHRPGEGAKCITISSAQGPQSTGRSEVWPVIHRSVRPAPTCWRESVVSGAGR